MPTFESVLDVMPANIVPGACDRHKLLSISSSAEDHAALRRFAGRLQWDVSSVATCWKAIHRLTGERFSVIICEAVLEDGTWKDILNRIGTGGGAPPLIVTSRLADAYLWSEVLNLGGYDVLAKPFQAREVKHILTNVSLHPCAETMRMKVAGVI